MTGVTNAAPIKRKIWLEGDDAACQRDNSNGIMPGNTIMANPTMPRRKIVRPRAKGVEARSGSGKTESERPRKINRMVMTERRKGCEAHARRTPGWIVAA